MSTDCDSRNTAITQKYNKLQTKTKPFHRCSKRHRERKINASFCKSGPIFPAVFAQERETEAGYETEQ